MGIDYKKTAKAYGTISEEKAVKDAENVQDVTLNLLDEEEVEATIDEKIIEEKKTVKKTREKRTDENESNLEAWNPKTKLGNDVKNRKIKNIDEILDKNQKILEPEIVDSLLSIKTDLLSIGQAKGKFGGGKRRAWRQTQRVTQEGGVLTFSAMAIVGDENGHVGIGMGKASETLPARDKATRKAKLNIIKIKRGCASFDCNCSEPHTVPFIVEGKAGSVKVKLIPAPQGTGLVVAGELKKILKLAGIKDVYSKTFGLKRTTYNLAKACIEALKETNKK